MTMCNNTPLRTGARTDVAPRATRPPHTVELSINFSTPSSHILSLLSIGAIRRCRHARHRKRHCTLQLSSTSRCNQMDSPWRQESELSSDEDSFEALAPSAAERDKQTRWLLIARGGWSDEMHMTCPGSIDCRPLQALEMSIPRHACPGVPRRWRSPFNESRHAAALPVLLNVTESLQLNGLAAAWSINLSSRFGVKTRGWPHSSQTARAVRRPNISATPVLFSVEAWRHTISRPRQELARFIFKPR
ncbi:hypothetical protein JOL62DRAFT_339181 [Phyllosticta paracitricarpa]|uniref:Uncharacterized protein n=1 Tax=Phyllosticta paracitricarpa TaxID=2016321 RepID=A0ABR1MVC0_9PEZI